MKYRDNMIEIAQLQPDYLGFIFYEKSSRCFDGQIPELPKSIKKVGVFVDAEIKYVIAMIKKHHLNAVQLHGSESPEYCDTLRQICRSGYDSRSTEKNNAIPAFAGMTELIKVFSIKNEFDFSVLQPYETVCDYFLFDTKGKLPGGNGYTFNWDVLKNNPSIKPFFLSGGIGLNEIEKLKRFQNTEASKYCHAIDVNSKFEIEAGLKHTDLLKEFKKRILK